METLDCLVGIMGATLSVVGFWLGRNGTAYVFVILAFIYCVINLIDKVQENKNG